MKAVVLGAAAGGGFPQWNSNAEACRRARAGDAKAIARTQASLAVSGDGERWFLMTTMPHLGHPGEVLIVHTDVTEHHRMEEITARHVPNDPLTGLPNQQLFCGHLEQALDRARRAQSQVGLLYLDLDHFRHVNEKLGRAVGDQVLRSQEIVARP